MRVRQGHGNDTASSTSKRVGDIVTLLRRSTGSDALGRLIELLGGRLG